MTDEKLKEAQHLKGQMDKVEKLLDYIDRRGVNIVCNYHTEVIADKPVVIMVTAYYKNRLEELKQEYEAL